MWLCPSGLWMTIAPCWMPLTACARHSLIAIGCCTSRSTTSPGPACPRCSSRPALSCHARHPLMACSPEQFRPPIVAGVTVQRLRVTDPDSTLDAFQSVRRTGFGDLERPSTHSEIQQLRAALPAAAAGSRSAASTGAPAGTGLLSPVDGVGEVVGVATLPAFRRRGVASAVTGALVQDLFEEGGSLAWLDAEDEIARALYLRLGFRDLGMRLDYVDG